MRKAFIASILFHLGVVVVALVGIPVSVPLPVEIVDTMEVDIADLTVTTKNQKPPRKVEETKDEEPPKPPPAPKPRPAPPEPEPEPEPAPPEPEKAEEQPAPPPPPEPKESEVAKPEPEPAPPEPPKEQKVAIVTPVAKPRPKPAKKKDDFESMLKTIDLNDESVDSPDEKSKEENFFDKLDLDSIETEEKPKPREKTQIATILGTRLTVTEIDAVRRQFENCWNVPIGARNPEELIVEVKVRVNRDRTVRDAVIVDQARTASDTFYRTMAESAYRAVKNPKCSPLKLPPDKYDGWKEMTVVFDPSGMVGR